MNRLANEKSPYLLQHASNPVDWYPWGQEAFARARANNQPIFLSIGYSTCHWCHVMAHESFENEATAAIMNREFVNIKVDREERPDVDRVYMTFVQATTGGGGWPMSVWLTPDLKPFVGGTYFPPQDRYGHPAFSKVLLRIAEAWKEDYKKITEQGSRILEALRESQQTQSRGAGKVDAGVLQTAYEQFASAFDSLDGGFGTAPKFPRPVTLNFLTTFYARTRGIGFQPICVEDRQAADTTAGREHALEMVLFTLRKMAAGGMHDHIGGGFHRYSVDRYWHVPHFEKMLYDQAQLATSYLDAYQITQDEQYAAVARDILDYVARDMVSPEGGFFSAEDADSSDPVAAVHDRRAITDSNISDIHNALSSKKEGAFYVWTEQEITDSLGTDAELFKFHFGVQSHGNAPEGSDPHEEFRGKNILIVRHTVSETAEKFGRTEDEVRQILDRCRKKLLIIRSKRPRPHLDDKIIAGWNGLMISGYARAAGVLADRRYLDIGTRAARFVRENLHEASTGLIYRSHRDGRGAVEGFADDYAFLIQGLIDLYEATFEIGWLKFALQLQQTLDRLFFDDQNGGYFSSSGKDGSVILRMKDDNDGAEPAASSIAALSLLRLSQFQSDASVADRARRTIHAFATTLGNLPSAMPQMLVALDHSLAKPRQIVIAGKIEDPDTKALLDEVRRHFIPDKVLMLADGQAGQAWLAEKNEAIQAMSSIDGKPAAYVCENFTCKTPVTDPAELRKLLLSP